MFRKALFCFCLTVLSLPLTADDALYTHAGRIVAIGDLHGDYDQYVRILKANQLVDDKLKWRGEETHLVQLGDVTDRGPDSLKIIEHLRKLEKQARRAGGKVHVLVGNHEAMNVQTDLRYVHPGEYSALVTRRSGKNQQKYVEAVFNYMLGNNPELEATKAETIAELEKRYPPGYVEHRQLWEPGRELARWYANQEAVIQINDTIFLHGGLDPHQETYMSLEAINEAVSDELSGATPALSVDQRGPLWYRGLNDEPEETLLEPLTRMLNHYGAKRIMIAHSPTYGAVMPRLDGKIIRADVGISAYYGGALANVVIEDGRIYAMHRGERFELPRDVGVDDYLDQVVKLEPENSRLARYVRTRDVEQAASEAATGATLQTEP